MNEMYVQEMNDAKGSLPWARKSFFREPVLSRLEYQNYPDNRCKWNDNGTRDAYGKCINYCL